MENGLLKGGVAIVDLRQRAVLHGPVSSQTGGSVKRWAQGIATRSAQGICGAPIVTKFCTMGALYWFQGAGSDGCAPIGSVGCIRHPIMSGVTFVSGVVSSSPVLS